VKVTVDLPDEIIVNPANVARELLEAALIASYLAGKITIRKLGKHLGLDYWGTEEFLQRKRVPLNYTGADLEIDRKNFPSVS
jgi:predicted HTH domain antitoxin